MVNKGRQRSRSIRTRILLLITVSVLAMGLILLGVMIAAINVIDNKAGTIAEDTILKQVQSSIQNNVRSVVSASAARYEKEKGALSDKQLFDKILDNIRNTKYSDTGYYFVYQYDGVRLVAPENKAQEGKNLIDLTDSNGVKPVQEFIKQSKNGGGFVSYMWLNPASNQQEQKISYVAPLKVGGYEVALGTGTYLPMIEQARTEFRAGIGLTTSYIILASIPLILILTALIVLVTFIFNNRSIIKPVKALRGMADRIALGDVDISIDTGRRDEIGELQKAFGAMVTATKKQAEAGKSISEGDLDISVEPRSEKDLLGHSMVEVISTLKLLSSETDRILSDVEKGSFDLRVDTDQFRGHYQQITQGINRLMDEASQALTNVKQAEIVAQKQARYQTDETIRIKEKLEALSAGDLNVHVDIARGDADTVDAEDLLNQIGAAINLVAGELKRIVGDISLILGRMSKGDFALEGLQDYQGDFVSISYSINVILSSFNTVLTEIGHASEQVAAGTKQVSNGSQQLSQGAAEQASAIEELTSSITQIAAQTRQNAANAQEANAITINVNESAGKGDVQMQQMLRSMAAIDDSSRDISRIIKVIDDIAFQTNILALNAAVEAARAGAHGKGFAVVAEEVRNLAAKSADAAKETAALIEGSMKNVDDGMKIARQTAEAFKGIMTGAEKAASLVADIAVASGQQATGIAQISKGVEQVSVVVQSNSATAQQSAAASEELASQAETLKGMVGQFSLRSGSEASVGLITSGRK